MSAAAEKAAAAILPPMLTGTSIVKNLATSSAAARAAIGAPANGKCYITFAAVTTDCFVILKLGTAAASVTTTTGYLIPASQERSWWVDPKLVNDVEAITVSATGSLRWFVSSPPSEATP